MIMAYLLEEEEVCLSSPKDARSMPTLVLILSQRRVVEVIMAYLLEEEEVCPSSPKNERTMTMVIFVPSSIESCGGIQGISSREEGGSALPISNKKRKSTMVIFIPSSVETCDGGHGLCHHLLEKRKSALLVRR